MNERHEEIIEIINQMGYLSVEELSKRLYVSNATVRRDLSFLEKEGLLRRTHGGASIILSNHEATSIDYRSNWNVEGKQSIAKEAVKLVDDGMSLFIDSASTTVIFSKELIKMNHLNILTNNISIASLLGGHNQIMVELTGGSYNAKHGSICGNDTTEYILKRHADILFVSASGFNELGITTTTKDDLGPKHAFHKNADLTVLLMDHTKYEVDSYYLVYSYDDIDVLIVDQPLNKRLERLCKEHKIHVIVARGN